MCHDTIGSDLIEIQSQPSRKYDTLKITDGVPIGNRHHYYTW